MLWTLTSPARFRPCLLRPNHRLFSSTPKRWQPRHTPEQPRINGSSHTPSFREQLARGNGPKFSEGLERPSVKNQVLFFVFGSFVAFSIAAKVTNVETYKWTQKLAEMNNSVWGPRVPSNDELRRARYYALGKTLQDSANELRTAMAEWPESLKNIVSRIYVQVAQPMLDMGDGRRMCWAIGVANAAVFLMWKVRRLHPFMMRNFTHHPLSGRSFTMLTSTFSHESFMHLAFNSIALTSFGTAAHQYLMTEQNKSPTHLREATSQWHLLAFIASAGVFSALVSHVATALIKYPRLIAQLTANTSTVTKSTSPSAARRFLNAATPSASSGASTISASLGISGAAYAAVILTALAYPDAEMRLIFPPGLPTFSMQWGAVALVMLDTVGIFRGWRLFDHWAHLGGALFGAFYYAYGPRIWDFFRVVNLGSLPPELVRKKKVE